MKLSYTTFSVQEKSLAETVELAKRCHLDGIELRGWGDVHISPSCSFEYVENSKKLIREAGLLIPCLTAYTKLFQPTVEEALQQADELKPMIDLAGYIGASTIRIFMGSKPEDMERDVVLKIARAGLERICQHLIGSSVRVVIETHDSVKDGRSLVPLLDGISPQIGVLLDIIHPWELGEEIEETWKLIGNRIYHVHMKDIRIFIGGRPVYSRIGSGILPVRKTVDYLLSKGYDGFFSLEWEPSAVGYQGVGFEEQMQSFLDFMGRNGREEMDAVII